MGVAPAWLCPPAESWNLISTGGRGGESLNRGEQWLQTWRENKVIYILRRAKTAAGKSFSTGLPINFWLNGQWLSSHFGPRGSNVVFEKSLCLCFSSVWVAVLINSCFSQSFIQLAVAETNQAVELCEAKDFRHATVGFILFPAQLERQYVHDSLDDTIPLWVSLSRARWASLSLQLMSDLAVIGRTVIHQAWQFWFYRESNMTQSGPSLEEQVPFGAREIGGDVILCCFW